MQIIDLTLPLYTGMPVFPGNPEVSIELVSTFETNGWNMRRIQMNGHDGTHVNAPIHGTKDGKNLDDYSLEQFQGPARIYNPSVPISPDEGIIFRDQDIDQRLAEQIKATRPLFVGLSSNFEVDIDIEKDFLREDIILFEKLANLDQLPDQFHFYGMPLKIKGGDGSPVRAFAVVSE